MARTTQNNPWLSRRHVLKHLAGAPLLLRSASLRGLGSAMQEALPQDATAFPLHDGRYLPHYPVRSPLEDVLRLVTPGLDDYPTEQYAFEIGLVLDNWCRSLQQGDVGKLRPSLATDVQTCSLRAAHETRIREGSALAGVRRQFAPGAQPGVDNLLQQLREWIGSGTHVEHADLEMTTIEVVATSPLVVQATLRFSLVLQPGPSERAHSTGAWRTRWRRTPEGEKGAPHPWLLLFFQPLTETRCTLQGPGFIDVTEQAFGGVSSHAAQLQHGSDFWRSVLDGACGIDVYGNNGVAAGDYDNDGFDDLYVSQPAGLPNRLYRNRGDGTFEDVTEQAGVGVLDNTACALFADFRNVGLQDLLVVCGSGPLLFQNRGDGTFAPKRDAFRFAQPPQGTFTHAAIADYDRDGRLDVYFCLYSYYLGLDQYHYPTPYFDARNGPPNFLMQNQGDGTFIDRTAAAGLTAENDRYSFACAWGDAVGGKAPDLYVVNDFGRNNLYRSKGDGTFTAVSEQAHVQDVGAGMSACWTDTNNDGKPDLYVANMWSAAGQRVSQQPQFQRAASADTRDQYRRHARGNALYRNAGNGTFDNVSDAAGVETGRWAWCSDAFDFDHDGRQDLYVSNGYITAPQQAEAQRTDATPGVNTAMDLGSFFWRQVVARSPNDATPSLAYEHGWNALNELIRTDSSWSGRERNVLFANNGDGTFSDVSGALGLDFLEDSRAFALADLDGDGRLEVVVKNRNAPQLRIVRNAMQGLGDSLTLRLRGTKSNRDAIGAVVVLQVGHLTQTRPLQAGTGFLSQHSKELLFGLGKGVEAVHATVYWPSGAVQQLQDLPRNSRIEVLEGKATVTAKPFSPSSKVYASQARSPALSSNEVLPSDIATWLIDPLKAPGFTLPALDGSTVALESKRGVVVLLHLWATTSPASVAQLERLEQDHAALAAANVSVLAVNLNDTASGTDARVAAQRMRRSYPVLFATQDVAGVYNLIFRYLFDRRANMPLPTSFLLDTEGMIAKVYQGTLHADEIIHDSRSIPSNAEERVRRALPFPGTLYLSAFGRNDFTYGVAMFQHGYLDQAADSFQQVLATRPNDAEAHYNLGTLSLRRNNFEQARQYLRRTLELKPNYPEAWNNLGMMAAQQGQTEEAMRSFQQSLELRPNYATALLNLGNLYRHEHDFAKAQQYLMHALNLQPDDPEANYSVGMLYAQQNQVLDAQRYLQQAIDLRPDYPEALNNLGVLFVREEKYARAEELFQTGVRLLPTYDGSYLNLARLYLLQRDKGRARATLLHLLQAHPDSAAGKQALQALDATP